MHPDANFDADSNPAFRFSISNFLQEILRFQVGGFHIEDFLKLLGVEKIDLSNKIRTRETKTRVWITHGGHAFLLDYVCPKSHFHPKLGGSGDLAKKNPRCKSPS